MEILVDALIFPPTLIVFAKIPVGAAAAGRLPVTAAVFPQ
jgi:hypothetical protein